MSLFGRLFGKKDTTPERDEDQFAQLIISALRKKNPSIQVEYDPVKFELLHVDDGRRGQRMFLHNSFAEYQRQDVTLDRIVDFIIECRSQMPHGDAALDMLLPVLRPRADTLAVVADSSQFSYGRSSRTFCDNMLLMLALDSEAAIALLNDAKLDELGISFDDALGIAIAQLDEKGNHTFGQMEDGIFVSACGDFYDSSRVLLHEMFEQLPLKGQPVVIVQARSTVLVTGSEDLNGLGKIAEIALAEIGCTERAVSLTPIELVSGKWRPFKILPSHPLALRNLLPNQKCWSFNATREAMQQRLGDDVFVANPMLVEKDGAAVTLAVWPAGIVTACPVVDGLAIEGDEEFPQIIRRMEDVVKVCGQFPAVDVMPYPSRVLLPVKMSRAQRQELTDQFSEFDFDRD